jgi:ParB family chromosome partitioning protein
MRFKEIPVSEIKVDDDRLRKIDDDWIEVLCGSIEEFGLKQPIEVRELDNGYKLVAGAHRLAAYVEMDLISNDEGRKSDEFKKIPSIVIAAKTDHEAAEFRIHEITENIIRRELNALHRAAHLAELKEAYEALHPETKHGGDRKSENQVAKIATRFSTDAAEKTGLSERSIRLAVKIHKNIAAEIRERVDGTRIAEKQSELLKLSELNLNQQRMVCDLVLADQPAANNVDEALAIIYKKRQLTAVEKKYLSINRALDSLKDAELDNVFATHEIKIMAWLERTGRR